MSLYTAVNLDKRIAVLSLRDEPFYLMYFPLPSLLMSANLGRWGGVDLNHLFEFEMILLC